MEAVSPQRTDKPQNRPNTPAGGEGGPSSPAPTGQSWRWLWGVLAIGIVAVLLAVGTIKTTNSKTISYTKFLQDVSSKQVSTAQISNSSGEIIGKFKDGASYQVQGPSPSLPNDVTTMRNDGVQVSFPTPSTNIFSALLPYLFIVALAVGFIYFIGRQTRGQMSGIMSIGRSKAKTFSSDRPSTTFDDVAGYTGVKQEISEVVDFLKTPARFKEIGAKIPKGVLLVGPPGTGKTLIARAVAGEAGVPFMSVSGSDFMEMFVGRRGQPGARPVPDGPQAGPGHHLRRRDRLHRPQARRRPRWRPRRAGADAQPDALGDGRLRHLRGRGDDRRHQPARHPRPRPPAARAFRPPDRRAAARPRGAAPHPGGALQGQADGLRRRPRRRGPGHPRHERRRPGQPGQRGGPPRRAPRQRGDRHGRLRGGARPGADRPAPRVHGPLGGREGARRLPRGRPRRAGLRARARRPGAQGHDPPDRHGARGHPPAPHRGAPHPPPPVHRGLAVRAHGRPLRRAARLRGPLHRRRQRPGRQHRAGAQDGARVGHERRHRADGVGLAGTGLPGRGPHAHPRLLRGHVQDHRRRGRADPALRGDSGRWRCSASTGAG